MKTVAIIQARMTSTRLPGKVLLDLCGKPVLSHVIDRVSRINRVDHVCVTSPEEAGHDMIGDILPADVSFIRGSEADVLSRYHKAALATKADVIMRITSDCPFLDPSVASGILELFLASNVDYASNHFEQGYPLGFEVEVLTSKALATAESKAKTEYDREHVTPYIWQNPDQFSALYVDHKPNLRHWRLVLDEFQDYDFTKAVYERLYPQNPEFGLAELKKLFEVAPELLEINEDVKQKPLLKRG